MNPSYTEDPEFIMAMHLEAPPRGAETSGEENEVVSWVNSYAEAANIYPEGWGYENVLFDIQQKVESGAMSVDAAISVKQGVDQLWGRTDD